MTNEWPMTNVERWRRTASSLVISHLVIDSSLDIRHSHFSSLPLDCARWFGRDVEADAINAFHFVDDPARDARQDFIGHSHPIGRHPVLALDNPQRNRVFVGAQVAHHTDGANRK